MNGHLVSLLFWIIQAVFGLLILLIGLVGRLHLKADDEHKQQIEKALERSDGEILRLRDKMHEVQSKIAGLEVLELTRRNK